MPAGEWGSPAPAVQPGVHRSGSCGCSPDPGGGSLHSNALPLPFFPSYWDIDELLDIPQSGELARAEAGSWQGSESNVGSHSWLSSALFLSAGFFSERSRILRMSGQRQ